MTYTIYYLPSMSTTIPLLMYDVIVINSHLISYITDNHIIDAYFTTGRLLHSSTFLSFQYTRRYQVYWRVLALFKRRIWIFMWYMLFRHTAGHSFNEFGLNHAGDICILFTAITIRYICHFVLNDICISFNTITIIYMSLCTQWHMHLIHCYYDKIHVTLYSRTYASHLLL